MAITANGLIARENGETDFVSENEWKHFSSRAKKIGNLVIGKKTFEIMQKGKDFERLDVKTVCVVSARQAGKQGKKFCFAQSPKQALQILRQRGFKTAFIGGGGTLNASFLEQGLVDELFLDVEPVALGSGVPLFFGKTFEQKMELVKSKQISKNEIQLHYRILKK